MKEIQGSALGRLITAVSRRLWWARVRTVLGRGALCAGVLVLLTGLAHRLLGARSAGEAAILAALPLLGALAVLLVLRRPGAVIAARVADGALGSEGLLLAAVDQSTLAEDQRAGAAALVLARAERLAAVNPLPALPGSRARGEGGITLTLALVLALAGAAMLGDPGAVTGAGPAAPPSRAAIAAAAPPGAVSRARQSLALSPSAVSVGAGAPLGARPVEGRTRREDGNGESGTPGTSGHLSPVVGDPPPAAGPRFSTERVTASEGPSAGRDASDDGAGAGARHAVTPAQALLSDLAWRHRNLSGGAADTVVAGGDAGAGFAPRAAAAGPVVAARPAGGTSLNFLTPGVRAYAEAYLSRLGSEP